MTTWAAVPFVEVMNHVIKFDICTDNGKIKSRSDPIWSEMCKTWKLPSGKYLKTPIALFFDFQQNRHQIYDRYVQERGLNFSHTSDNNCISSSETKDLTDIPESKSKFIGFYINFTKEEWLKIKPVEKLDCNNKKYYTLQSSWTDVISELIYISQKLPCAFKFSKQYVQYLNSENNIDKFIVKISGSCTETSCKAAILGECVFTFSEDENVKMLIHAANTINIPHSKKRHITGNKRREFAEDLQLQKGDLFKRRLINKYLEYGDQAAPIIPNAPVITQIRHEGKKNRLNIQGNVWESLKSLKHNNVEFQSVVKQIGFDKFFLMYWTHQQIDIYNDLMRLKPIVSIDATGSVVRKIPFLQNYDSGPIFLYQIVTYINSLIVPVCQMLSERHDTKIVTFWIQEWISSNVTLPLEVVTDMSLALQNGLCLAFCQMTYKQYLSRCYQLLLGKSKVLIHPYVRIDIAHLINSVAIHKCFLSVKFVVKDFYLRAIGLMSTIEDLKDVVKMMKALLNISQNEYGCKEDINWIFTKIETFKFDGTVDYKKIKISSSCDKNNDCDSHLTCHDEELVDDSCELNSSDDSYLSDYIDKIVKETPNSNISDGSIKFDDVNPYFLNAILQKLITLFKQFPAWTNVMRKHYHSDNYVATSARSENYFKYVKENVLDDRQPTRADMFLIQHVQTISPRVIEARAAYDKYQMLQKTLKNSKTKNERKECVLNFKENWRNKNKIEETEDINLTNNQNEFSDNNISTSDVDAVITKCSNSENESEVNESASSEEDSPSLPADSEMKSISPVAKLQLSSPVTSEGTKSSIINSTNLNACKENNNLLNNHLELDKPKFHSTPNTTCDSSTNFNLSFKQNEENNFSIIIHNSPIKFKINENKVSAKRNHVFHSSTSCQPIKRGKYVNPFPEVQALHENANKDLKKNKKKKMIKNGSGMGSQKIGNLKISLKNTCPFDSITELLSFAYLNFKSFQNFIDSQKSMSEFLEIIQLYAKSGAYAEFYKKRFKLLRKIYPEKDLTITCTDDVCTLIENLLVHYESITEYTHCTECKSLATKKMSVFNVNANLIWVRGFDYLESSILHEIEKTAFYCKKCNKLVIGRTTNLGSYLCLRIDHFYEKILFSNKAKQAFESSNLKEIPINLNLKNKKYMLAGVIEFQPPGLLSKIGHFVTYTRTIQNKWTELNDLRSSPTILKAKLPDMRISLLLYVLV